MAALAACSQRGRPPDACPVFGYVPDGSQFTQFRDGPGRDPTDVLYSAEFVGLFLQCARRDDTIAIDMALDVLVRRGPAAAAGARRLYYFVAVTREPHEDVLAKAVLPLDFTFPEGAVRIGLRDQLEQLIALEPEDKPRDYRVFVGFQMTPEQFDYQRARGGGGAP